MTQCAECEHEQDNHYRGAHKNSWGCLEPACKCRRYTNRKVQERYNEAMEAAIAEFLNGLPKLAKEWLR